MKKKKSHVIPAACSFLPPQDVLEVSLFQSRLKTNNKKSIYHYFKIYWFLLKRIACSLPGITVLSHQIQDEVAAVPLKILNFS